MALPLDACLLVRRLKQLTELPPIADLMPGALQGSAIGEPPRVGVPAPSIPASLWQGVEMSGPTSDLSKLVSHIDESIGPPAVWSKWPGGWPDEIATALVDAVFSARAVYRTKKGRGVYSRVAAWREADGRTNFTLEDLAAEIRAMGIRGWQLEFGSKQVAPSRSSSAPHGRSKAAAVLQAANALVSIGISNASDLDHGNADGVKHALRTVPGIGYATANYFLMLLGTPGVKPDRMVHRFLLKAIGRRISNAAADSIVTEAASELGVEPHLLDHAIWCFESGRVRWEEIGWIGGLGSAGSKHIS